MDEYYLFINSYDSLEFNPGNRGGDFRISLPRSQLMNGDWEVALMEMTLVPAFETSTSRIYVCSSIVGEMSYVRDTYLPLLQSVSIRREEKSDIIFDRPLYRPVRCPNLQMFDITLKDDRLQTVTLKDDHVFCLLHFRKKL